MLASIFVEDGTYLEKLDNFFAVFDILFTLLQQIDHKRGSKRIEFVRYGVEQIQILPHTLKSKLLELLSLTENETHRLIKSIGYTETFKELSFPKCLVGGVESVSLFKVQRLCGNIVDPVDSNDLFHHIVDILDVVPEDRSFDDHRIFCDIDDLKFEGLEDLHERVAIDFLSYKAIYETKIDLDCLFFDLLAYFMASSVKREIFVVVFKQIFHIFRGDRESWLASTATSVVAPIAFDRSFVHLFRDPFRIDVTGLDDELLLFLGGFACIVLDHSHHGAFLLPINRIIALFVLFHHDLGLLGLEKIVPVDSRDHTRSVGDVVSKLFCPVLEIFANERKPETYQKGVGEMLGFEGFVEEIGLCLLGYVEIEQSSYPYLDRSILIQFDLLELLAKGSGELPRYPQDTEAVTSIGC